MHYLENFNIYIRIINIIDMGREINVAFGNGENNQSGLGFRAGCHHVKVNAENKNTFLKIHYRNTSGYN